MNNQASGVPPAIIGVILTIGGIIGLVSFVNYITDYFFEFGFGGCNIPFHFNCLCGAMSIVIVLSVIALLAGVTLGIYGLSKISKSK